MSESLRTDLLPYHALAAVAELLGNNPHLVEDEPGRPGWLRDADDLERDRAIGRSLERHLRAHELGQKFDQDSGMPPSVHMAARALMIADRDLARRRARKERL